MIKIACAQIHFFNNFFSKSLSKYLKNDKKTIAKKSTEKSNILEKKS